MREIKFRGKGIDNGEWIYGDLLQYRVLPVIFDKELEQHEVDAETVGQYTGLRDKNGKEIYEGDVVNMKVLIDYNVNTEIDRTYTGVVAVIPSKGVCMKRPKFIDRCEDDLTGWCDYNKPIAAYRSEVVGNIYENPELMEGKE